MLVSAAGSTMALKAGGARHLIQNPSDRWIRPPVSFPFSTAAAARDCAWRGVCGPLKGRRRNVSIDSYTLTHTHTHRVTHPPGVCVCVCVADPHLNNQTKPALPPFSAQINRNTLFLFVMNATHLHIRKRERERERKTKHEPNLHIDPKLTNGNEGNRIFQRHEMLISIFR